MNNKNTVKKQSYAGIFMVALATLMYEILLTRIFSVTMFYHFAFMAISLAMFGMSVGAILVYLLPQYFSEERAKYQLSLSALIFSLSIVISFLLHLLILISTTVFTLSPLIFWFIMALLYIVLSVPFIFSGICICLALTKFPRQVSKLYAFDLLGAAAGCILLIYILKITDGPTAVFAVAFLAGTSSAFFAADAKHKKLMGIAITFSLICAAFTCVHTALVLKQSPLLRLKWVKGKLESRPIYEKWNSFSRIRVWGTPDIPTRPYAWGLSSTYRSEKKIRQLHMNLDAYAATPLTAFDGKLNDLEHLKYDITNIVHYLKSDAETLVVGSGGGRDVLSALLWKQKAVTAVEINEDIIDTVNQRFGDFTGHLDRYPQVTFVSDEARSYIARQTKRFDIIQVSLIDTFAATASGAFVLTENALYTVEAWKIFLEHLTPGGILTFSRWYFIDSPGAAYRLTSLARVSLAQLGVKDPRKHVILVRNMRKGEKYGVGTILVSSEPFSDEALDTLNQIVNQMKFELVLTPKFSIDSTFETIASDKDFDKFTATFPIDITAPTDDSPFFFNMFRLKNIFSKNTAGYMPGFLNFNMRAVYILGSLLIIVTSLTVLCILCPLILTTTKATLKGTLPLFIFFACIGFGFMLVEISQMQRLIIFLGHPTYSLSVVLFSLLVSSGLGSYLTQKIEIPGMTGAAIRRLLLLLCVLVIFGIFTEHFMSTFQQSATIIRILVASGILFPIGLFMGMAFPLGMKIASARTKSLTPWLWGINGATSVCASVLAVAIALNSGISSSFWTGFFCYTIGVISFTWELWKR